MTSKHEAQKPLKNRKNLRTNFREGSIKQKSKSWKAPGMLFKSDTSSQMEPAQCAMQRTAIPNWRSVLVPCFKKDSPFPK
jgi:hypothetical protein